MVQERARWVKVETEAGSLLVVFSYGVPIGKLDVEGDFAVLSPPP